MAEQYQTLVIQRMADIQIVEFVTTSITDPMQLEQLRKDLLLLVDSMAQPKIVLNFASVAFISSQVMGTLMLMHTAVKKKKGDLRLAGVNKNISEAFKIIKLHKLLRQYPDVTAATKKM